LNSDIQPGGIHPPVQRLFVVGDWIVAPWIGGFAVDSDRMFWVDQEGNFAGWMTEEQEAECLRQAVEAALVTSTPPNESIH
jgi:hypothetical protein